MTMPLKWVGWRVGGGGRGMRAEKWRVIRRNVILKIFYGISKKFNCEGRGLGLGAGG